MRHNSFSLPSSSLVGAIGVKLGVTRVSVELVLVDVVQLRAAKAVGRVVKDRADLVHRGVHVGKETREQVRQRLNGKFHSVAQEIVALGQSRKLVDSASQVGRIEAGERVDSTGVSTNGSELYVCQQGRDEVNVEVRYGVGVGDVAGVPVLWDALVARGVCEVSLVSGNGEEALQNFTIQTTFWVLGRLVGHEAIDESICCRLDNDTGEWTIEEVGVLLDILVETVVAVCGQDVEVVVVFCLAEIVQGLEV